MKTAGVKERRGVSRWPVAWIGHVRTSIVGVAPVEVRDVSHSGAQLRLPVYVARVVAEQLAREDSQAPIELTFALDEQVPYPAPGRRCWHYVREDGSVDIGMRFDRPLPDEILSAATQRN